MWRIGYTLDGCSGWRHCVLLRGNTQTFDLRLASVGDRYEGDVDLGYHVSVSGTVDANGDLVLTGARPDPSGVDGNEIDFEQLVFTASAVGAGEAGGPRGDVHYVTRGRSNADFFGTAHNSGPIINVERLGSLDQWPTFTGTWTGEIPVTNCVAVGWTRCYPWWESEVQRLSLHLNDVAAGNAVTGTVKIGGTEIPVTGVASGGRLHLTGSASPAASGVTPVYRIEAKDLATDALGRMTGTLQATATWDWHDGRAGTWRVDYPALPLYATARSVR